MNTYGDSSQSVHYFRGLLKADSMLIPSAGVKNSSVDPTDPIQPDKLGQQINRVYNQKRGTAVIADLGTVIHVCYPGGSGIGTIQYFQAGVAVAGVTWVGTVTVDLKKNGVSVLSGTISITGSTAAFALQNGTFTGGGTTYSGGDVFEVVVTISTTSGTPPQGLFAQFVAREPAA